jgi:glutaminyl-tRNA synthetase
VDSLEQITHSMCTLEFETRRASYYWLLHALGLYCPVVWEYSRLNITHSVLSKRRLNRLVTDGHVAGWDDPRLLTLAGLRRRGVTPAAVNAFCRDLGITRAEGEVHPHKLEHYIRTDLDATSPRVLAVLRPLRLVITNLAPGHVEQVRARSFPGRTDDTYEAPFSRVVYIEASDFRTEDARDYYGLAPGKTVMLRYAYAVTATGFTPAPGGGVAEVQATYDPDTASKKPPKGVLNWVGQPAPGRDPPTFEARLYEQLFCSPTLPDDWLADLNPASVEVVPGAFASPPLAAARPGDRFQLERLGYFCVDPAPGAGGGLALNRTVTLKESAAKQSRK